LLACDTPAALKKRADSSTLEEAFVRLTGRSTAPLDQDPHE